MPDDPSAAFPTTSKPPEGVASQRTVYPYRFGEVGVMMSLLDREKVREALNLQKTRKEEGKNPLVGELMVERGWITPRQVAAILVAQKRYRTDSQAPQAGLSALAGQAAQPAEAPATPEAAPKPKRNSERNIAAASGKKPSERNISAASPKKPSERSIAAAAAGNTAAPASATPAPVAAAPAQGGRQKLGHFELIRKLGEGAMGQVFEAYSLPQSKNIALKILPRQLAQDHEFVERFKREIKLMGALGHPHIVELYDAGVAGGYYYYAMEFIDGETLDKRLKRNGKMEEKEALRIAREMALGLAHAHAKGMIHRDIKPENIMLTKTGTVKITDFGLAKPTEDKQHLTAAGFSIGTPFYISPEQALGKEKIDHRAYLYGIGAALFHLLTGRVPFEHVSSTQVMVMHVQNPPPDPRSINPAVSRGAAALVLRLLAKDPDQRYPDGGSLAEALQKLIDGEQSGAEQEPKSRTRKISSSDRPGFFTWLKRLFGGK